MRRLTRNIRLDDESGTTFSVMAGSSPAMTNCSSSTRRGTTMNAPFKHSNEAATSFARRHIGPSPRDVEAMLETVGVKSLAVLMGETLPSSIRQKAPLGLGRALSETEALAHMGELARENQVFT